MSSHRKQATLPITPRQRDVLNAIKAYIAKHGYPPSMRELGEGLGIKSTNAVNCLLTALRAKGYLAPRVPMVSRGIRLTGKAA